MNPLIPPPPSSEALPPAWPPASTATDPAAFAQALITSRFSVSPKRLGAPGPSAAQLQAMVEAAGCAPDHERLHPWRLIRIAPAQRTTLAEVFVQALLERLPEAGAEAQAQARQKAFRAPELLLAVARPAPAHPNVPAPERFIALGAALMNLLLAAHGQGYAAMLTSGQALRTARFAQAFALGPDEAAACFVSIGTASEVRRRERPAAAALMSAWEPDATPG